MEGGTAMALIYIATACALVFLALQKTNSFSFRPAIKASMAIVLALACLLCAPVILLPMTIGFALSAAGDYFLDLPGEKYFMPGLISFFVAHTAYLVFLWPHVLWAWPQCVLIGGFTLGYFLWLCPSLEKQLVIPVAFYSVIIALMGIAAVSTQLPSILIPIGAALFIASDVVLAVEKFKFKFPMDKTVNWILYASGQIALAVGVLQSLSAL